jgi:hypothetical protein
MGAGRRQHPSARTTIGISVKRCATRRRTILGVPDREAGFCCGKGLSYSKRSKWMPLLISTERNGLNYLLDIIQLAHPRRDADGKLIAASVDEQLQSYDRAPEAKDDWQRSKVSKGMLRSLLKTSTCRGAASRAGRGGDWGLAGGGAKRKADFAAIERQAKDTQRQSREREAPAIADAGTAVVAQTVDRF